LIKLERELKAGGVLLGYSSDASCCFLNPKDVCP
jgi:hypothetical protein